MGVRRSFREQLLVTDFRARPLLWLARRSIAATSCLLGVPRFSVARRGGAMWADAHEHRRNAVTGKRGGSGRTRTTGLTLIRGAL